MSSVKASAEGAREKMSLLLRVQSEGLCRLSERQPRVRMTKGAFCCGVRIRASENRIIGNAGFRLWKSSSGLSVSGTFTFTVRGGGRAPAWSTCDKCISGQFHAAGAGEIPLGKIKICKLCQDLEGSFSGRPLKIETQ